MIRLAIGFAIGTVIGVVGELLIPNPGFDAAVDDYVFLRDHLLYRGVWVKRSDFEDAVLARYERTP